MWKEAFVTKFEAKSWHLPGRMGENNRKPQSGQVVSGPRYELGCHEIRQECYH
jgi:hypothetical protein